MISSTLRDVIAHAEPITTTLRVEGTSTETVFKGASECKNLMVSIKLAEPIGEFEGGFGIPNLKLLKGLLDLPSYHSSEPAIKRRPLGDSEIVEKIEFGKGRNAATFRFMAPALVPEIPQMTRRPTWDVNVQITNEALSEFGKLAALYREVGGTFVPTTEDGKLVAAFGSATAATHHASMTLSEDADGELAGECHYSTKLFQDVMKIAGNDPAVVSFKSRTGPMAITVVTDTAEFEYILRGSRA